MNADGTDQHCLVGAGRAWFGPWIADHPAWAPGALARASASPTITYAPISIETPVSANSAVTVTATITSDVGVTEAILFYRDSISVIWGGDYTPVPLTRSGVTYSGTMPTGDVEYYIEARDAHGNISRAPWGGPFVPYWVWVAW